MRRVNNIDYVRFGNVKFNAQSLKITDQEDKSFHNKSNHKISRDNKDL